jgi:hypothetical protein
LYTPGFPKQSPIESAEKNTWLLDVLQHANHDLATALNHPEYGQLLAETDAADTTPREYLYLDDRRLAMVASTPQSGTSEYSFYGTA